MSASPFVGIISILLIGAAVSTKGLGVSVAGIFAVLMILVWQRARTRQAYRDMQRRKGQQ